ncbi:hypothetical protein BGW80DRAFT_1320974 [Lactifluus volemus]|nr:hypothetical protein BGW80DRAFT_1320974 [Lactifluus volemus]
MPSEQLKIAALTDYLTIVKVLLFMDGMKMWNILGNLNFDLMLLKRNPPSWPGRIYLAERAASLACAVSYLVGLNVGNQIHCQAWISTAFFFPLLELELAMVLIAVRVIAIWKLAAPILVLMAVTLSMHSVAAVYLLTGVRAFWDPGEPYKGCVVYTTTREHLLVMSIVTMGTYAILLISMLVGLLRHQKHERMFGVWPLLFYQGWMWLALAVAAEVPTLILVLADVKHSIHLLLQVPRVVIASLGTTAMFRALYNYQRPDTRGHSDILRLRSGSGSLSRPTAGTGSHDLKISVNSSTVAYADTYYPKEGP